MLPLGLALNIVSHPLTKASLVAISSISPPKQSPLGHSKLKTVEICNAFVLKTIDMVLLGLAFETKLSPSDKSDPSRSVAIEDSRNLYYTCWIMLLYILETSWNASPLGLASKLGSHSLTKASL